MNSLVFPSLFEGRKSLLLFCFNLLIEINLYSKHASTVTVTVEAASCWIGAASILSTNQINILSQLAYA